MGGRDETRKTDDLLRPFLEADDSTCDQVLATLVSEHAEPVARSVIGYKLRVFIGQGVRPSQDAEDVYGEVVLRLLTRLQSLRRGSDHNTIGNFRGYVRVIASNACAEYLRRKYPHRSSLEDKLRYLLNHKAGLASWKSEDEQWLCGLDAWRNEADRHRASTRSRVLRENPNEFLHDALPGRDVQRMSLLDLATSIFNWLGAPIELDDLVQVIADLQGVRDIPLRGADRTMDGPREERELRDPRATADYELGERANLERLWKEICQLPVRQRFALIMNLRDAQGADLASVLPLTGVCTFRELAQSLDLDPERLAELFRDLPLDDATIASHLGVTRQQVINLRKSARERLVRRMRGFDR
jgi:RNA polymerase sigma factor (sigma-70 family)